MTYLKYVYNDIQHSERSSKDTEENTTEFWSIIENNLKKSLWWRFIEFNHDTIDGTIKKEYNSNNTITKKETRILVNYYKKVNRPIIH